MLALTKAEVLSYRSIENSGEVDIDQHVTALVGKNMSGKTVFLRAIEKSRGLGNAQFEPLQDYPRKDWSAYNQRPDKARHDTVVRLTFAVPGPVADRVNREVFGGEAVMPAGDAVIWSADYANHRTAEISFDPARALSALRVQLAPIPGAESMFAGASTLEEVLTRAKQGNPTADPGVGRFISDWEGRAKIAAGAKGLLQSFIWKQYLEPHLPLMAYFDSYNELREKYNLNQLTEKRRTGKTEPSDETLIGLLELAGTTVEHLAAQQGYEASKASLEALGSSITRDALKYWRENGNDLKVYFDIRTDPTDLPPYNSGPNLYVRIENRRHDVTLPLSQSSKGFIWFFSFIAWFRAAARRAAAETPLILLLDEPGLSLHALAQRYFLDFIEDLSEIHQIIYTTHSPFMVEAAHLDRVRVVEDRPGIGTTVTGDLRAAGPESLFPLQAALGYTVAQNLLVSPKNLLVEGPSDLVILTHMSSALESAGRCALPEGTAIVPTGGLDRLATFVALLAGNALEMVVVRDKAASPEQAIDNLTRAGVIERRRIISYATFRADGEAEGDVEDLFPQDLYIKAFNEAYAKELAGRPIRREDLAQHPRIVERLNRQIRARALNLSRKGGFDHYRVAKTLTRLLEPANAPEPALNAFGQLFARVSAILSPDGANARAAGG